LATPDRVLPRRDRRQDADRHFAAGGPQFHDVALVTIGTTAGMMLANVPAVFAGRAVTKVVH